MVILKGVITGLILSLPFGPVGIYCMEKAVSEGEKKAYISALGMVTVDVIYGIISFLFISRLEDFVLRYESILKIIISLFLIIIGSRKFLGKPKMKILEEDSLTLVQDYFETFFLAVFNISSLLVIAGIFTMLEVLDDSTYMIVPKLALGIALGGASSWASTIAIIYHFKKKVTVDILLKLSKLSGLIILIFGILAIIFAFYK